MPDQPSLPAEPALPVVDGSDLEAIIGTVLTVCRSDREALQAFVDAAGREALAELSADIAAARRYFLALADVARLASLRVGDAEASLSTH